MNDFLPDFDEIIKNADSNYVLVLSAWLVVAVLSGCWSASISEKKMRSTLVHLLLGFAIPIIYPFFILLSLPAKHKKATIEEPEETNANDDLDLPFQDLNANYFKNIYLDTNGQPSGPFIIDTEDSVIKAEAIIEVQKDFIVVETMNRDDAKQRLRVPYSKMTSCSEAEKEE